MCIPRIARVKFENSLALCIEPSVANAMEKETVVVVLFVCLGMLVALPARSYGPPGVAVWLIPFIWACFESPSKSFPKQCILNLCARFCSCLGGSLLAILVFVIGLLCFFDFK